MAKEGNAPKEFLIVFVPDNPQTGATLRLLGVEKTLAAAQKAIEKLDTDTLGRVAILERKELFVRRPAVESVSVTDPIATTG